MKLKKMKFKTVTPSGVALTFEEWKKHVKNELEFIKFKNGNK